MFAAAAGLACSICQPVDAQVDAADQFANPLPESGRWFPNDGSGTGFFIEVQNGIVAGLYAGGDANGNSVWLSFRGVLQPGATVDGEGAWILDADLLRFSGTDCIIDCTDGAVGERSFEDVGDIRIDFRARSQGMVWVDDQPVREIAPLYFGVARTEVNPSMPPVFMPQLQGKWVVALASSEGFPDEYLGAAVIEIGERVSETLPRPPTSPAETPQFLHRNPIVDDPDGMFPPDSEIECIVFVDPKLEPLCSLVFQSGPMASFRVDFDWITDARLTVRQTSGVSGDGFLYQLFKLNYD
ncbi:MAG: hypothetical protein RQ741_06710 [Wenzhouxiangellaceae bacterium]|nr:hypothetical protein [Wenzhouxiangellaceae bacterium]